MNDIDRKWMLRLMADRVNEAVTEMRYSDHMAGLHWGTFAVSEKHRERAARMRRAYLRRMAALLRIATWGQS